MTNFLKEEFGAIGQFFKSRGKEIILVAACVLFICLNEYRPIGNNTLSIFLYYALFPLLLILVILRKNPLDYGLRWGSPRVWWPYVLITCVIASIILFASSFDSSLKDYYIDAHFNIFSYFLVQFVVLAAQEFMFRGVLISGLRDKFKEGAILIQLVPFVLVHLGKPEIETISCVFTGILFGWIAYRGKSFWPAFIIHMFINVFFVGLINWRYG